MIYNADETKILIFDVNKVHIVQSITGSFLQDVIVSSGVVFKNSGRGCMLVKQREAFPSADGVALLLWVNQTII